VSESEQRRPCAEWRLGYGDGGGPGAEVVLARDGATPQPLLGGGAARWSDTGWVLADFLRQIALEGELAREARRQRRRERHRRKRRMLTKLRMMMVLGRGGLARQVEEVLRQDETVRAPRARYERCFSVVGPSSCRPWSARQPGGGWHKH
jgi:hypothetical protein